MSFDDVIDMMLNICNLCDKLKTNFCGSLALLCLCSWISFPCFYLDNSCIISFLIVCSAKSSFFDRISFKLLSTSLGKTTWKFLLSVFIRISLCLMYISIVVMTALNCCKVFWWFYCVDKVNTLFVWFLFLVFLNYF